jgi:hypothetical protein
MVVFIHLNQIVILNTQAAGVSEMSEKCTAPMKRNKPKHDLT